MKKRNRFVAILLVACMVMMFGIMGYAADLSSNSVEGQDGTYTTRLTCASNRPQATATFVQFGSGTVYVSGKVNYYNSTYHSVQQASLFGSGSSGTATDTYNRANVYDYVSSLTNVLGMKGSYQLGPIAAYSGLTK